MGGIFWDGDREVVNGAGWRTGWDVFTLKDLLLGQECVVKHKMRSLMGIDCVFGRRSHWLMR